MTDMQLIVAPSTSEQESQGNTVSNNVMESTTEDNTTNSYNRSMMSDELRENFESMKAVWREARRTPNGEDIEELRRKEREVALQTAVAVDSEISRWKNGIAELEALLAAEEAHDEDHYASDEETFARDHRHAVIQFPAMPPVVPPEEDGGESCSDGSNKRDDGKLSSSNSATTTDS